LVPQIDELLCLWYNLNEILREQINRVDKENIKMKKKMDLDNLNKQQQYYAAQQQQAQQFNGQENSYYGQSKP
jgi:hypothetical protein